MFCAGPKAALSDKVEESAALLAPMEERPSLQLG
jgi:hypothetical protein